MGEIGGTEARRPECFRCGWEKRSMADSDHDLHGERVADKNEFVQRGAPSRRAFIKGVIASGAAASAAGYLFRAPGTGTAWAQPAARVLSSGW